VEFVIEAGNLSTLAAPGIASSGPTIYGGVDCQNIQYVVVAMAGMSLNSIGAGKNISYR
jgi:hypothetical protein